MSNSQDQQPSTSSAQMDRAGKLYWSETWEAHQLPALWRVDSNRIADYVDKTVFAHLKQSLLAHLPQNGTARVLEAGCARSAVLPLIRLKLGYNVAGIDYSHNGCEQARLLLLHEGVNAEIHCGDIFSPPDHWIESFDAVVSFGLIEHFSDTTDIVRALARFLKPGGVMFTNVPNLRGVNGLLQKIVDRETYDIHVPLSDVEIREAHVRAGLNVLQCDYCLPVNFGILNLNSIEKRSMQWLVKKLVLAILVRISMSAWWWDSFVRPLPTSRSFSPFVHCVSRKSTAT